MVKCQWCKEEGFKDEMHVEAKDTGQLLKSGKPKLIRKYTHKECLDALTKDKEFKQKELHEFDKLYQYLKSLHNLDKLDSRMIEKLQDLRNGSVKLGAKKVSRYKDGVTYPMMLETYKYIESNIQQVLYSMSFEKKWNEFSYVFAIMSRSISDVKELERKSNRANAFDKKVISEDELAIEPLYVDYVDTVKPVGKKKDKLDISDFL
jgi:hypothetical protein